MLPRPPHVPLQLLQLAPLAALQWPMVQAEPCLLSISRSPEVQRLFSHKPAALGGMACLFAEGIQPNHQQHHRCLSSFLLMSSLFLILCKFTSLLLSPSLSSHLFCRPLSSLAPPPSSPFSSHLSVVPLTHHQHHILLLLLATFRLCCHSSYIPHLNKPLSSGINHYSTAFQPMIDRYLLSYQSLTII